jgi:hypothetical protein
VKLGRLVDDGVHRQGHEVAEHDLQHRSRPRHRGADRHVGHALLADRRVEHAGGAVFLMQAAGEAEGAAAGADVLSQQPDQLVARHLLVERMVDRPAEGGRLLRRRLGRAHGTTASE